MSGRERRNGRMNEKKEDELWPFMDASDPVYIGGPVLLHSDVRSADSI